MEEKDKKSQNEDLGDSSNLDDISGIGEKRKRKNIKKSVKRKRAKAEMKKSLLYRVTN